MINENELWKINDLRMRLFKQKFVPGEHVNIDCSFAGNCWNEIVTVCIASKAMICLSNDCRLHTFIS